jgi:hypothetical protein
MDKQQFASIAGNFLAWEFELKDAEGGTLALIDRNFQVQSSLQHVNLYVCLGLRQVGCGDFVATRRQLAADMEDL